MASPNPESKEDKPSTAAHQEPSGENATSSEKISATTSNIASPPANEDDHRAKEEQYWRKQVFWQRLTTIFTVAAAAAAIVYACLAHRQVIQTQTLAKTATTQLELSERPWVGVLGVVHSAPKVQDLVNGKTMLTNVNADVTIKNFGKSPALDFVISVLPTWWTPEDKWIYGQTQDKTMDTVCALAQFNIQRGATEVLYPDQPLAESVKGFGFVPSDRKRLLYIIGCAFYGDKLTPCDATHISACHRMRFCSYSEMEGDAAKGFSVCPTLNDESQ